MRQVHRQGIITGAILGALPLLLTTGCSFEFSLGGPSAVDAAEVAERSSEMLEEQIGQAPDDLTCSEDLPAEVGAEIRCELTHGGESLGVTVTTTEVDGNDVRWDVVVDDLPAEEETAAEEPAASDDTAAAGSDGRVPASEVARVSAEQLAAVVGQEPEELTCSEGLPAEVGAEIRCNLVDGGMNYGVTVTTTAVNGTDVEWDVKVDDAPL
ncbi:DUF4333 domain-containing protein [Nocardiopsis alba]|uniref:DUF4333 domain-containing protein n=2 Tax=Nocardiopsis alba TaxID=53437 RepID=A0A7K2ITJ1_9ACTN|nr:DUF4333 domain-containing protein [Nocardiopsis alba]AFR09746.1 hypothetical protein B005_2382 [Nocardiopsis alba ATCC BAA-2165]MYR33243.1 DUF4333 domain-containing protein [Nocardiopsis alba]